MKREAGFERMNVLKKEDRKKKQPRGRKSYSVAHRRVTKMQYTRSHRQIRKWWHSYWPPRGDQAVHKNVTGRLEVRFLDRDRMNPANQPLRAFPNSRCLTKIVKVAKMEEREFDCYSWKWIRLCQALRLVISDIFVPHTENDRNSSSFHYLSRAKGERNKNKRATMVGPCVHTYRKPDARGNLLSKSCME